VPRDSRVRGGPRRLRRLGESGACRSPLLVGCVHALRTLGFVVAAVGCSSCQLLHVQRHQTLPSPASPSHALLRATGRGKLVGVCVMLEGHALPDGPYRHPMVFLEGDVRAMADGHPVLAGTGTEDYFDSAFYFAGTPQATPFAQDWGVISAGASGRANACRWHVLGSSIDFESEIDVSLAIGPGRGDVLDRYRSVAFYYQ
jgi:hypothetical protein